MEKAKMTFGDPSPWKYPDWYSQRSLDVRIHLYYTHGSKNRDYGELQSVSKAAYYWISFKVDERFLQTRFNLMMGK